MELWGAADVASFVKSLGLSAAYEEQFRENDITGELLVDADHAMLRQLGVESVGHRISIINAIAAKRSESDSKSPTSSNDLMERMSGEILRLHSELAALRQDLTPVWYIVDEYKARLRADSKVLTPSTAFPQDTFKRSDLISMPGSPSDSSLGTIRICLDCIFNIEGESTFKNFRVSDTDVCSKILAGILKKYEVSESWKSFCLYVRNGGKERRLNYDEKPLALQNKMRDDLNPIPTFTIKRTVLVDGQPVTPTTATSVATMLLPGSPTMTTSKRFPTTTSTSTATTNPTSTQRSSGGKTYVAIYNYKAARDDELNVEMGNRFKVIRKDREWVTVRSLDVLVGGNPVVGWVPIGCLKELDDDKQQQPQLQTRVASKPGVATDVELPVTVCVLYDYDGTGTSNALAVKAGLELTILKKDESWLYARLGDKKGWVPDAYVALLITEPVPEISGSLTEGKSLLDPKNPLAQIASLLDHFDEHLQDFAEPGDEPPVIVLTSGKSVNLMTLIEDVNLGLGRWIEMEHRQVSVLKGDKNALLEQLKTGLEWIALLSAKLGDIRNSPKVDDIAALVSNASDACKLCGMGANVDEDKQLELVCSSLQQAVTLIK